MAYGNQLINRDRHYPTWQICTWWEKHWYWTHWSYCIGARKWTSHRLFSMDILSVGIWRPWHSPSRSHPFLTRAWNRNLLCLVGRVRCLFSPVPRGHRVQQSSATVFCPERFLGHFWRSSSTRSRRIKHSMNNCEKLKKVPKLDHLPILTRWKIWCACWWMNLRPYTTILVQ